MTRARRELAAAKALWREFREEPPRRSRRIPIQWPKVLMVMGTAELIGYTTTHGGRVHHYVHQFAPGSRPLLCAGKKKGQLYLIGDRFTVNAHGIVDLDRQGRRLRFEPTLEVVRKRRRRPRA